jgi:hypothetical protein
MKAYGGSGLISLPFLNSALDGGGPNNQDNYKTTTFPIVLCDEACMDASGGG